ncbi:SSRG protein, partial [Atractosteus spatula]|nr:SSRG protein [Atractosteus spatula]
MTSGSFTTSSCLSLPVTSEACGSQGRRAHFRPTVHIPSAPRPKGAWRYGHATRKETTHAQMGEQPRSVPSRSRKNLEFNLGGGGPSPAASGSGFVLTRRKSSALFYGNALIVSAIPIWLYWRIWHMDLVQSAVLYSVMTLVSTYLVAFAYKNVKFVLKHKVAQKREDAVSKEVTRKLSEADNKRMSRKEKDERLFLLLLTVNLLNRILWKKNEVADYEATTFSIFYNNTLFLVLVIIASFFLLKNFNPTVYPFSRVSRAEWKGFVLMYCMGKGCPLVTVVEPMLCVFCSKCILSKYSWLL